MAQVIFTGDEQLIKESSIYKIVLKINNGERLTSDERIFLYKEVNDMSSPQGCAMLMGVIMDFRQVMKRYFVESDYGIVSLWAFDKASIRASYSFKIYNIVEVPNRRIKK